MSKDNKKKELPIKTKLEEAKDNVANVTINLPKKLIKDSKEKALKQLQKQAEIKGFRKGNAPLEKVEEHFGSQKVNSTLLDQILPQTITQTLEEHDLSLVGNPRLTKLVNPDDEDWEISLQLPLLPEIDLGDYRKDIKDALAASDIWTPGKGDEEQKPQEKAQTQQQKLNKIFEVLKEKIDFEVPQPIIESEVQRSLSRLVGQTEQLGVSVEEYLESIGKTADELKEQYTKTAKENLKLELIIEKIVQEMDIEVDSEEVDKMINASGDENAKKQLDNPNQRAYVKSILKKRKAIDSLLNL